VQLCSAGVRLQGRDAVDRVRKRSVSQITSLESRVAAKETDRITRLTMAMVIVMLILRDP